MSSVTDSTFQAEALNVIFQEAQRAAQQEGCRGVAFEGRGPQVWVADVYGGHTMGQEQRYAGALWADICLAMRLTGLLSHRVNYTGLVRLQEGVGFGSALWSFDWRVLGDNPLPTLVVLFQRVDRIMALINEPLDMSVITP